MNTPSLQTVKVSMFGDVAIADGAIIVMDGGTHGVQGHTLSLSATNEATWERRLDGMRPNGRAGAGRLALTANEVTQLREWANGSWKLAPSGNASYYPESHGPPRWVWAIVLRQGNQVRMLNGGGMSSPTGAPEPAGQLLAWLVARVDAASNAAP